MMWIKNIFKSCHINSTNTGLTTSGGVIYINATNNPMFALEFAPKEELTSPVNHGDTINSSWSSNNVLNNFFRRLSIRNKSGNSTTSGDVSTTVGSNINIIHTSEFRRLQKPFQNLDHYFSSSAVRKTKMKKRFIITPKSVVHTRFEDPDRFDKDFLQSVRRKLIETRSRQ